MTNNEKTTNNNDNGNNFSNKITEIALPDGLGDDIYMSSNEALLDEQLKRLRSSLQKSTVDITQYRLYKPNDFRRELIRKHIEELKRISRLTKISVSIRPAPIPKDPNAITMDTSRSGSNVDVVRLCLKSLKWREYPNGKRGGQEACDIVWSSVACFDTASFIGKYVNKFPNIGSLLHKINLSRSLDTMRTLFPLEYDFYPTTWYLPHQLQELSAFIKQTNTTSGQSPTFIVKPDEGTQGEGIYLLKTADDYKVHSKKNHVVQEYLDRPLLLDGYKFDLRVYVVLWSIMPLKIYICREGLARFCTELYEKPTSRNIHQSFMHLTNYSLNKHSNSYNHSQQTDEGSKRTLSSVFILLEQKGYDVRGIWRSIEKLACRTILALLPEIRVAFLSEMSARNPYDPIPHCFQILGFDVLLLDDGKAMLLEVNSNPSLRIDGEKELAPGINEYYLSRVDVQVKRPLVLDALRLVQETIYKQRATEEMNSEQSDMDLLPFSSLESNSNGQLDDATDTSESSEVKKFVGDDCTITVSGSCPMSRRREQRQKELRRRQKELTWIRAEEDSVSNSDDTMTVTPLDRKLATSTPCLYPPEMKESTKFPKVKSSAVLDFLTSTEIQQSHKNQYNLKDDLGLQESCLSEIYPGVDNICAKRNEPLSLLEKVPDIFHESLGLRQTTARMGASAFRVFSRKANLSKLGFTNAAIDLTFIDVQRRWEYVYCDCVQSGLSYQAFLEAFFRLAFSKYATLTKRQAVSKLIEHCSRYMNLPVHSRYSQPAEKVLLTVQNSQEEEEEEEEASENMENCDDNEIIVVSTVEETLSMVQVESKDDLHLLTKSIKFKPQNNNTTATATTTTNSNARLQRSPQKRNVLETTAPIKSRTSIALTRGTTIRASNSSPKSQSSSTKMESTAMKELRDYLFRNKNKHYSHLKAPNNLSLPMLQISKKYA